MFWKNFRRELIFTTSRLVSVVVIAAVAVLMFVALSGNTYNAERIAQQYFKKQNVADLWVTGVGFDRADFRNVSKIDGIKDVQPRTAIDAESRDFANITLALYAVPDEMNMNIPYIVEGETLSRSRDIMISDEFARANGLSVGDFYEVKLTATGDVLKLYVCALVKSPECMHHVSGTNLTPDLASYGFGYISEDALAHLTGRNSYNQICVTATDGADLENIKAELSDCLGTKLVNILALEDNINAYELLELTNSIKTIVMVFPLIFFAVAALIMFSTMSRLIENARQTIGTFKALGYGDVQIMCYYLFYAVLVVILGYIIGVLPARALSGVVLSALFGSVDMPPHEILYSPSALVISFVITFLVCIGTAYFAAKGALSETPAECMRPKPPKKTRKTLLEQIPPVWNRLGFNTKYIFRNIMRNKSKMAICIVGITGCMTLVLTALGINDSVSSFIDRTETKLQKYDLMVTLNGTVTEAQYKHLGYLPQVEDSQYEMTMGTKIYSRNNLETVYFRVTDDQLHLKLLDLNGPETYDMPEDGVILGDDTAKDLAVTPGDEVQIKFTGDNRYYPMRVGKIIRGADGAYVSKTYWNTLGKPYTPNTAYLKTNDLEAVRNRVEDFDFVAGTEDKAAVMTSLRNQVKAITSIVYLLILFGGILAFVVLYNLGIMSFFEQIRSLATLQVLGFYDKETKRLLLTENIIFTAVGVILGVPLGKALVGAILGSIEMVKLDVAIAVLSYFAAGALTLVFAVLVNRVLGSKIKTIDMLGALKSVE